MDDEIETKYCYVECYDNEDIGARQLELKERELRYKKELFEFETNKLEREIELERVKKENDLSHSFKQKIHDRLLASLDENNMEKAKFLKELLIDNSNGATFEDLVDPGSIDVDETDSDDESSQKSDKSELNYR